MGDGQGKGRKDHRSLGSVTLRQGVAQDGAESPVNVARKPTCPHGFAWWHIQVGTYCSWLPGDKRGFRSHDHGVHSSGDYKKPPPEDEHAGLWKFHKNRHPEPRVIDRAYRLRVATTIAETLLASDIVILVVAVSDKHAHLVAQLPTDLKQFNRLLGRAKAKSSAVVPKSGWTSPTLWAHDDNHKMLRDRAYQLNAFAYVRNNQGPKAAIWCFEGLRRDATRE
jgi:REP element-mobilizing transposase RayT